MKRARAQFGQAFGRLALAHHAELDDPTMEVYWESLKDIPIGELTAALDHLTKHAAGFFPKPGEIRAAVDALPRPPALPPAEDVHCAACGDTCWLMEGATVTRCDCWPTNPVYRAQHHFAPRRYFEGAPR